jgi:hypothetical protein
MPDSYFLVYRPFPLYLFVDSLPSGCKIIHGFGPRLRITAEWWLCASHSVAHPALDVPPEGLFENLIYAHLDYHSSWMRAKVIWRRKEAGLSTIVSLTAQVFL